MILPRHLPPAHLLRQVSHFANAKIVTGCLTIGRFQQHNRIAHTLHTILPLGASILEKKGRVCKKSYLFYFLVNIYALKKRTL